MAQVVGTQIQLGLNDKDLKTQIVDTKEVIQFIVGCVDNATIMQGLGVFTHDDGTKVVETSLQITQFGQTMQEGMDFAQLLARKFNQECVCCTPIYETATEFVGQ